MKKTVVAVLTACVLLVFASQLMSAPGEIEIKVKWEKKDAKNVFYIDMGEKYAYAVERGSTIKWTCDYPFQLIFEEKEKKFFKDTDVQDTELSKVKKVLLEAEINHIYKYTVTVTLVNGELELDPIIIIIPPRK
jgi:hypothetical protein